MGVGEMKITAVHVMLIIGIIWGIFIEWREGPFIYDELFGEVTVYDDKGELVFIYGENGEKYVLTRDKKVLDYFTFGNLWMLSWIPITITAIIFSILGMLKNDAKKILVAAILYVVPLFTIPSAVLCFVCFAKIRKKNVN
jgi:Na+/H+-dicarboxylate symporter